MSKGNQSHCSVRLPLIESLGFTFESTDLAGDPATESASDPRLSAWKVSVNVRGMSHSMNRERSWKREEWGASTCTFLSCAWMRTRIGIPARQALRISTRFNGLRSPFQYTARPAKAVGRPCQKGRCPRCPELENRTLIRPAS